MYMGPALALQIDVCQSEAEPWGRNVLIANRYPLEPQPGFHPILANPTNRALLHISPARNPASGPVMFLFPIPLWVLPSFSSHTHRAALP